LVGQTTFGTGTVLQPYILADGSALLLGTRQWLTPEGRLIRKQGITPDYEVPLPIEADLLTPEEIEQLEFEEVVESEDTQLLKALELLGVTIPSEPEESSESEQ
jgi:carboxyl-terminal processing protease